MQIFILFTTIFICVQHLISFHMLILHNIQWFCKPYNFWFSKLSTDYMYPINLCVSKIPTVYINTCIRYVYWYKEKYCRDIFKVFSEYDNIYSIFSAMIHVTYYLKYLWLFFNSLWSKGGPATLMPWHCNLFILFVLSRDLNCMSSHVTAG